MHLKIEKRATQGITILACHGRIMFGDEANLLRSVLRDVLTTNHKVVVDLADDRRHRKQGEEQREADDDLVGRDALQPQGVAGEQQHHDEAGERGHQQEDRRRQRRQPEQ